MGRHDAGDAPAVAGEELQSDPSAEGAAALTLPTAEACKGVFGEQAEAAADAYRRDDRATLRRLVLPYITAVGFAATDRAAELVVEAVAGSTIARAALRREPLRRRGAHDADR